MLTKLKIKKAVEFKIQNSTLRINNQGAFGEMMTLNRVLKSDVKVFFTSVNFPS